MTVYEQYYDKITQQAENIADGDSGQQHYGKSLRLIRWDQWSHGKRDLSNPASALRSLNRYVSRARDTKEAIRKDSELTYEQRNALLDQINIVLGYGTEMIHLAEVFDYNKTAPINWNNVNLRSFHTVFGPKGKEFSPDQPLLYQHIVNDFMSLVATGTKPKSIGTITTTGTVYSSLYAFTNDNSQTISIETDDMPMAYTTPLTKEHDVNFRIETVIIKAGTVGQIIDTTTGSILWETTPQHDEINDDHKVIKTADIVAMDLANEKLTEVKKGLFA